MPRGSHAVGMDSLPSPADDSRLVSKILKLARKRRSLQAIYIVEPNLGPTPAPSASMAPTYAPRRTRIVVCPGGPKEMFDIVTEVHYSYTVQVTGNAIEKRDWDVNIPSWVSGATVDTVAGVLCASPGGGGAGGGGPPSEVPEVPTLGEATKEKESISDDVPNGNRRLLTTELPNCVSRVSAGKPDEFVDNTCEVTTGTSCARYNGYVNVAHTGACSKEQIETAGLAFLQGNMIGLGGNQIKGGEIGGAAYSVSSVTFGDVIVEEKPLPPVDHNPIVSTPLLDQPRSQEGGLTAGGKTVVAFLVLMLLALLFVFCLWRRHVARRQRKLNEDMKSVFTEWSGPTADYDDNESHVKPDFHDLGLQHSKLDVHRCSSSLCKVCQPDLGVVSFLPTRDTYRLPGLGLGAEAAALQGGADFYGFERVPSSNSVNQSSPSRERSADLPVTFDKNVFGQEDEDTVFEMELEASQAMQGVDGSSHAGTEMAAESVNHGYHNDEDDDEEVMFVRTERLGGPLRKFSPPRRGKRFGMPSHRYNPQPSLDSGGSPQVIL